MSFNAFFWHAGVHVVRALIHNLLKKKIGLGQQEGTCGQACLDPQDSHGKQTPLSVNTNLKMKTNRNQGG